jgi:hypothetical protein
VYYASLCDGGPVPAGNLGICVNVSTDGGVNFGPTVHVATPANAVDSFDKEWLAVDQFNGNVLIAYSNFRPGPNSVEAVVCTAGLTTCQPAPTIVATGSLQGVAVTYGKFMGSEMVMAWHNRAVPSIESINCAVNAGPVVGGCSAITTVANVAGFQDGPATAFCTRNALKGNFAYEPFPVLASDYTPNTGTSSTHLMFTAPVFNAAYLNDVAYYRSSNDGITWPVGPTRVNDDPNTATDQFFPHITVSTTDPAGRLNATWYDRRNDGNNLLIDLYHSESVDNGLTWNTNGRVTDVSSPALPGAPDRCYWGDYLGHASTPVGDRVYAAWGDDRRGQVDVFFATLHNTQDIRVNADLDFGSVCTTETRLLQIFNTGDLNLTVNNISFLPGSNEDLSIDPNPVLPVTISPDGEVDFTIRCSPTPPATIGINTLRIESNDPDQPQIDLIVLCDEGGPNITTSGELDFGELCVGESETQTIQVCNTGKCDLTVTRAELVGPDCDDLTLVSPTVLPLVISPDFCFEFVVKFEPDDDIPPDCRLEIDTDDLDNPMITVPITATVGNSDLVLDPADLTGLYAFPATVEDPNGDLGCYSDRMLVARNVGTCPLVIDDMSATAPFSVIAPTEFPITLPPGEETLDVTVRLAPTNGGGPVTSPDDVTGTFTVVSNDPGGDETAVLCGEVAAQSGVRILMVDSSDDPINGVDMLTLQSKGIHTPKPIHIRMTDVAVSQDLVCGNTVRYHMQQEDLPPTHTTGNDPNASYHVRGKEGNKQTKNDFILDQCEFKDFILRLR